MFTALLLLQTGRAARATPATEGPTVRLPDLQATLPGFEDFKFPAKGEVIRADFLDGSATLMVTYPGKAFSAGVPSGSATVGVMLDPQGRAVDFLLVRYTQPYFGEALLQEAKTLKFSPKRLLGIPVYGSFHFTYAFEAPAGLSNISSFDAFSRRIETVGGGSKYLYAPHSEKEIDRGQLEPLRIDVPVLPAGYPLANNQPVRVVVSFYVDEQGRVRLPNIESSLPAALMPRALAALQMWAFKPPTLMGEAVLVQAARALTFRAANETAPARK